MNKLILISFDGVGSDETADLQKLPNFQRLLSTGRLFKNINSVFVSNTYPVHTSIVTGVPPCRHGIISNVWIDPALKGAWCYDSRYIKCKTLWQAAHEKGLKTASVLWPVSGWARGINWNIPEVVIKKGQSQFVQNLKAGSVLSQLDAFIHHGHFLDGIRQPALDTFAVRAMIDIIRKKKPDFMLLHLTAFDALCHKHGRQSPQAKDALVYLDRFLGMILDVLEAGTTIVLFSDHAELEVHTNIHLNSLLKNQGFLQEEIIYDPVFEREQSIISGGLCFFHYAGGSAFLFESEAKQKLSAPDVQNIQKKVLQTAGVDRLLTVAEMQESGFAAPSVMYPKAALFGVCAKDGYYFEETNREKTAHGYPLDRAHYKTFCAVNKTIIRPCTSVLDITKLAAAELACGPF